MTRYFRPTSRQAAIDALAVEDGKARAIVGGTDLLVGLRHHTIEPSLIVDLKAIDDVPDPIQVDGDVVRVGPTLTLAELADHPTVQQWFPALVEAALTVGSVAIRNRASLIGNLCNASPAADTVGALLVHDARVTIASADGERQVSADEFLLGPRRTLCAPDELVVAIELSRPAVGQSSAFQRLTRRRGVDLATASAAASVDADGQVSLGLGAVGPRTLLTRFDVDGSVLEDARALHELIDERLHVATPISDIRGSQDYRTATIRVLAKRAVLAAARRREDRREAS